MTFRASMLATAALALVPALALAADAPAGAGKPAAGAPAAGGAAAAGADKAPEKQGPDVAKMAFGPDAVMTVVKSHIEEIQACYEDAMASHGSTGGNAPGGRVTVSWTVTPDGVVTDAKIKQTGIKDDTVTDCMVMAVRSWEFPKPQQAQPIEFPFELRPWSGADKAEKAAAAEGEKKDGAEKAASKDGKKDAKSAKAERKGAKGGKAKGK